MLIKDYDNNVNTIDALCFLGLFSCMGFGLFFSLLRVNKVRYLEGEFTGELEFLMDQISANGKVYKLNEIQHIKIDAKDFRGYWNIFSFEGNFGDSYQSNGTDNFLELLLNSGEKVRIQFEQKYENQIHSDQDILKHYCNSGRLNYASLKDLLDYK